MGVYCRRDTTKTQAQMKIKRRILHMDTICLTSLRILRPFNFEICSFIAKVFSQVSYRQTQVCFQRLQVLYTNKKIEYVDILVCILEKNYDNGKGFQIRFCKIRNIAYCIHKGSLKDDIKDHYMVVLDTSMHLLPFWGELESHIFCSTEATQQTGNCDS